MNLAESCCTQSQNITDLLVKRIFDLLFSFMALLITFPAMLVIMLLISLDSRGPVIFRHQRIGRTGREFFIYKFRTMHRDAETLKSCFSSEQKREFQARFKLAKDPRVTRIGKLLRRTSLDELPQFLNVLKGDMSVVGPRPITPEELPKYGSGKDLILLVKPGITGLWQVSGRNGLNYEDRVELDFQYIRQRCFRLDIVILVSTIRTVLSGQGAC